MILVLNCGSQSIKWKLLSKKLKLVKENKIKIFDAKLLITAKMKVKIPFIAVIWIFPARRTTLF